MTRDEMQTALNRAADDVLDAIDAGDTGTRDVVNLVVNAAMHYADNPSATLDDAIRVNYDNEPDEVLSWTQG